MKQGRHPLNSSVADSSAAYEPGSPYGGAAVTCSPAGSYGTPALLSPVAWRTSLLVGKPPPMLAADGAKYEMPLMSNEGGVNRKIMPRPLCG